MNSRYATIFDKSKVDAHNYEDAIRGTLPKHFYIIEVLPNLYLRQNDGNYPVSITPYFSIALKFKNEEQANDLVFFDKTRWSPMVVEIKHGIILKKS